jgi:hypothetical protein
MPVVPGVILSTEHGCATRQKARQPSAIRASANLDGNSLGADRYPNLKPPAFAILGRKLEAAMIVMNVCIEPPILPRR